MQKISTRLAKTEDIGALAPLFDAYRQFYEQKADLALAAAFIAQRLEKNESILLVAEDVHQDILDFCQLYPTFCSVAAAPIHVLYDLFARRRRERRAPARRSCWQPSSRPGKPAARAWT